VLLSCSQAYKWNVNTCTLQWRRYISVESRDFTVPASSTVLNCEVWPSATHVCNLRYAFCVPMHGGREASQDLCLCNLGLLAVHSRSDTNLARLGNPRLSCAGVLHSSSRSSNAGGS